MADYHAVLQRTLAGFSDPKPQLRTKLYERARSTIQRQLEGRTPPVTGEALAAELEKLETAIVAIEASYDGSPTSVVDNDSNVVAGPMEEAQPPAVPAQESQPAHSDPAPIEQTPVEQTPVEQMSVETAPLPQDGYSEAVAAAPEQPVFDAAQELQIPLAPQAEQVAEPIPSVEEFVERQIPADPAPVAYEDIPAAPVNEPEPVVAAAQKPELDPLDEWAKEFMNTQPEPVQASAAPAPEFQQSSSPEPAIEPVATLDGGYSAQAGTADAELTIPPAPGFSERVEGRRKGGGFFKWLFLLILLGALGAAGYFGWTEREQLIERFGLAELFEGENSAIKPKPVKTISIKPEPATEEPAPKVEEPKAENRLTPDGREVVQPEPATSTPPVIAPATDVQQPASTETPAPTQGGALPISQRAILYEEGSTAAENTVDSGRIVWSVVQEEPAAGEPKEPAIRGRVEIPSRNVVLIMTIKRNSDRALPASHLIELVFAVPDDFSGGAIGQINRFVLKESEQGRGEGLVAVPARIADGIFLIALNNLEQAVTTNEQLLQQRNWIDIPMQYRTGRRALITIEKGVPGEAVFKEVFEAWKQQ